MLACVVVVPCYNEEQRLNTVAFRGFVAENPKIAFLFVDDGSTDGTGALLDELSREDADSFTVLHLERNFGKGEAIRRGMQEASRLEPTLAGYWDADLATPLDAILDFMAHLDAHPEVAMVFGARVKLMGRQIQRKAWRHYFGRVFATLASCSLGIGIYDTQCGAKLFRMSPTIDWLFEQPFCSRWIFDVEILARFLHRLRAANQGSVDQLIHEIPLVRWEDVAGSKVKPLDALRSIHELWMLHRIWLRKSALRDRVELTGVRAPEAPVPALAETPVTFGSLISRIGDSR
jgi:dolichyl-phosphate beta-glucosyltransferase